MKPAAWAGHRSRRLLPAVQQLRHSWPVDGRRGDRDAGEAGTEHATIATSVAATPRWGERARDWATPWRGALDDPGQSETDGGGRVGVAVGGRCHRRGAGASAFRTRRPAHGSASAGRAGLGGAGARVEAAGRDDDDPLGGIPGGPSRGVRLPTVLRPSARVRAAVYAGDAPAP